ncbi:unnamed protein product [Urochloa decumbens]|uniref:Serine protease n=1 Tax=Urochloa decumbens TaxID=240449 RepID=A0ABC9BIK8_9POAL
MPVFASMDDRGRACTTAANTAFNNHRLSVVQILGVSTQEGPHFLGSGFIIHKKVAESKCLVLTCNHVLETLKDGFELNVRLSGTIVDLRAAYLCHHDSLDLAVISIQVPNINTVNCLVFSDDTPPAGTLVALVSYYNPINLVARININYEGHMNEHPLISDEPGAVGGFIGPLQFVTTSIPAWVIPHSCYGIKGSSGGPIICHSTQHAIGVFNASNYEIHLSIGIGSVMAFLGHWLQQNRLQGIRRGDTFLDTIERCRRLY